MRGLQWYPGEFSLFLYHFESKMHKDYMYLSLEKHLLSLSGGHVLTCVHLFVGRWVCQQDDSKTTKRIPTKPGWRTGPGPDQNPLSFSAQRCG